MNSILLYYLAQCYGLCPFKYDESTPRVFESNFSTFISLMAGLILCTITIFTQTYTLLTWLPDRPKIVLLIISHLEGFFLVIQNVVIFLIHFNNRKKLVKFINEGFDLTSELKKICPREVIFSTEFRKDLRSKIVAKSFQILLLILTTYSFCLRAIDSAFEWSFGTLSIWMYIYAIMISSIFYSGSVLISARFYGILNTKLIHVVTNARENYKSTPCLKMQLFCETSDEIDLIAVLYNRIASFVEQINELFCVQIVVIQLSSFVLILSSVIFKKLTLKFY